PENYYYVTLTTTEDALEPAFSAWSHEALDREAAKSSNPEKTRPNIKWSYADSPYFMFAEENFAPVTAAFATMPNMYEIEGAVYEAEHAMRMAAMVDAMAMLNAEGAFGTGPKRAEIYVNVEVVPPDASNTTRALALNPPGPALDMWLEEAAEE
ncbi:MAG: DUF4303 domain-containing protein, partial [Paracoccus sp. (in: a-proteobacteria)]|nr:DUF4303 domain-containing protein [Paracoccus sp. (in: a-proteobacteria)]